MIDISTEKETGVPVFIDREKLMRAYAYSLRDPSKFGIKHKSKIYIFPRAFDELQEEEFKIILHHENKHCQDIFDGIRLDKETFDASKIGSSALDGILELRACYSELEQIWKIGLLQGVTFLQKVRLGFIQEREREYVSSYMNLKGILEKVTSPYEINAIKEHLLYFDKWILQDSRYKE